MIVRTLVLLAGVGTVIAMVGTPSFADTTEQQVQGDIAAIRKMATSYLEARGRGDAKALAAHWTADGTYVDAAGRTFNARQLISQQFGEAAPAPAGELNASEINSAIRFISSDVAIEEGTATNAGTGFTAVWVKQGTQWLLSSLTEFQAPESSAQSPLSELGWMIGDWVAINDEQQILCSTRWTENQKFIERQYTVIRADGRAVATQRIGWDPAEHRIRSWTFDSDGGIVEGRWYREGDAWMVKAAGVLPDGTRSSSVVFWIPEGPDRFVRKTSHTVVGQSKVEDTVLEFQRRTDF